MHQEESEAYKRQDTVGFKHGFFAGAVKRNAKRDDHGNSESGQQACMQADATQHKGSVHKGGPHEHNAQGFMGPAYRTQKFGIARAFGMDAPAHKIDPEGRDDEQEQPEVYPTENNRKHMQPSP